MADNDTSFEADSNERFSPESKVGLFVLAGMAVLMISILMLGDIHFRPQNSFRVNFNNVEGITDKSPVKIFGVEVGSVKKVELDGGSEGNAVITLAVSRDIVLYPSAKVRIRSTGIIGSKFIAIDPGHPDPNVPADQQKLRSGSTLNGVDSMSLDELMERVAGSLDSFTGGGKLGDNLNATMANLKNITESLNAAVGQQRQALVNIVQNVEGFSSYAKSVAKHLDEVLASSKEEIKVAVHNLKETLEKSNSVLGQIQRGEGAVGKLLYDKQTGENVEQTVSNLKQASESAKDVMARFTKVRAFWIIQVRRDFKGTVYHGDVGMRFEPRPNKFYEIVGNNLGDEDSSRNDPKDYERKNTITGLIGRHWGPFTGAVGAIRSRAGVEGRYRPFQDTDIPVANRLELMAQGFDFGRDVIIKGRKFDSANYIAGARVKVNKFVTAGVQAEDIAETTNVNGVVNVTFEDRDIAYLLGFVSFAQ
jgi:phospholipid/cholesterol/gamma-HCH transport system substrate-binding protein